MSLAGHVLRTCAIAVLLFLPPAPAGAETDAKARLVGTWLIEPQHYLAWLLSGVEVPSFALLAIRADGRFALYRGYPNCEPLEADGRNVDPDSEPVKYVSLCNAAAAHAREDGFVAAPLRVNAAGRWEIGADNRVRFISEMTGAAPRYFAQQLDEYKARLPGRIEQGIAKFARNPEISALFREAKEFLAAHGHRVASLHTTFYVFDGAPVAASVDGGILRLTGDGGAALLFRGYQPDAIDAAVAISSVAGVGFRYFACVLEQVSAPASGPSSFELRQLAARTLALAADWTRTSHAELLRRSGHAAEADRLATKAQAHKTFEAMLPILRHPGMRPAQFGAYFECRPHADP